MSSSRRSFIKKIGASSLLFPLSPWPINAFDLDQNEGPLKVHIFSKHLQFLDYKETGQAAAEIGFSGVDLTVRPKGHVLPENTLIDLPTAIKDIKNAGSDCKLMTTSISDATKQFDIDIIKTAAQSKVQYYRTHWFKYQADRTLETSLKEYQENIRLLGELNKVHQITGCYQNHSGTSIGSSFWELKKLVETVDPKYFGIQYDIRHAIAEGGQSWKNGLRLLKDNIKVIALKDFKWGKIDGKWKPINVPIEKGMVDFTGYFRLLKSYNLKPPVSLHFEYPLGGAEHGRYEINIDKKIVFDAMKRDLTAIQKLWQTA